jgi:hypothetical protein
MRPTQKDLDEMHGVSGWELAVVLAAVALLLPLIVALEVRALVRGR